MKLLGFNRKKFLRPQQSLNRLKNIVSISTVYVLSPNVNSERKYQKEKHVIRLSFLVKLPWLPMMQLGAWTKKGLVKKEKNFVSEIDVYYDNVLI